MLKSHHALRLLALAGLLLASHSSAKPVWTKAAEAYCNKWFKAPDKPNVRYLRWVHPSINALWSSVGNEGLYLSIYGMSSYKFLEWKKGTDYRTIDTLLEFVHHNLSSDTQRTGVVIGDIDYSSDLNANFMLGWGTNPNYNSYAAITYIAKDNGKSVYTCYALGTYSLNNRKTQPIKP